MTEQRRTALKDLQRLDLRILETRQRIRDFDPRFESVEEPALVLESELGTLRKRSQDMKLEERRLELSVTERRERLKKLEERLGSVRNLREEAAVSAELEMVKRALQSDEQETYTLIDQIRRSDQRIAELDGAVAKARAEVEPKRQDLLQERSDVQAALAEQESQRVVLTAQIDLPVLKMYDSIRGKGGRRAVSELTEDGACGNCYGVVPLQVQNEVRHGTSLIRCEACGVILAAPDPQPEEPSAESHGDAEHSSERVEESDEALVEE